jgi:molybdopterin converting factor small subunit
MAIQVTVHLKGPLNRYFKGSNPGVIQLPGGAVVEDLLQQLSLPRDKTSLLVVNGVKASLETPLQEGDEVVVFPPVSGG